jgi:hypothetical protein
MKLSEWRHSIFNLPWFFSAGAAEDGRAPTEELSCVRDDSSCSTKAALRLGDFGFCAKLFSCEHGLSDLQD